MVLLVLESDGACTGLSGHSARKSAVLFSVCWYKARGGREQELWGYWLPEGCIKQCCDKPSGYGCLSKKCKQGEQWSSDLAVSHTLAKLSDIQSENTRLEMLWFTPLTVSPVTQQLGLCFLYCFSGLSALLLLTYAVACKSEVVMNWTVWSVIHILGFITPNFLDICVMIIAGLLIFQILIWMGVIIGKCNFYPD